MQRSDERPPEPSDDAPSPRHLTRRAMLGAAVGAVGGGALGAAGAWALGRRGDPPESSAPDVNIPERISAHGHMQAGIVRPTTPQPAGLVVIGDLAEPGRIGFLPDLGQEIARLVSVAPKDVLPDGPVSLTVTCGLGPRVVAAHDPSLPGAEELPVFSHDRTVASGARGGDVMLAAYATDPTVLPPVLAHLTARIPGFEPRWSQRCFRGPGHGTVARNPLGFLDNIQVPRGPDELAENVWLDGRLSGGTICVIRRLRLDLAGFSKQPVPERENTIGRTLDGSPLSGGRPLSAVDVDAKSPAGEYLIPLHAHVRAAHPSFTGSHLMLRRGYAYDNGGDDTGLMFMCYQRDLRTFVATQRRLDRVDDLMAYVTPTGSATFLILPGFSPDNPLGMPFM